MNERIARSLKLAAILAAFSAPVALSSHQALAGQSRSTLSVMVQVVDPCEVSVDQNGAWLSFGCSSASFDSSSFNTQSISDNAQPSVVEGVEFVDVTY